jgi:hypothetical protein
MEPDPIRTETLKQLDATFLKMSSPEWDLALVGQPEEKTKADRKLLRVQAARLRLGNAALADIRGKLKENEDELLSGCDRLAKALEDLEQVGQAIGAVTSFLNVVARVVPLV